MKRTNGVNFKNKKNELSFIVDIKNWEIKLYE